MKGVSACSLGGCISGFKFYISSLGSFALDHLIPSSLSPLLTLSLNNEPCLDPTPQDFLKINVFVATPNAPIANGNENGVGVIL